MGVMDWLEENPTIALGGVVLVALVGGAALLSKKASSPTTTTTGDTSITNPNGLTNGNIVYVPTSTTFSNYSSTDASQTVSNTGTGNINTGSSSAGNAPSQGSSTGPSSPVTINPTPIVSQPPVTRQPPPTAPKTVKMVWSQHYTTSNQSLNLVATNATNSMRADPLQKQTQQRFTVTGAQIYNANLSAVTAWFAHNKVGGKTITGAAAMESTPTTGLVLTIPKLELS